MKNTKLLVALFVAAIAAGCGTTGQQSATAARPAAAAVDDGVVTTRVQAALAADPEIAPIKINVSTKDGQVTLKGEIKTMVLRKKVESIVRGVDGVRSLNNQLIITG